MGRPTTPFLDAVRQILKANGGEITYANARPELEKLGKTMGFSIADEPTSDKSEELKLWESNGGPKAVKEFVESKDRSVLDAVAKQCGFDEKTQKRVQREFRRWHAYSLERNRFDQAKFQWAQAQQSARTGQSRKPTESKNTKARAAAEVAKRRGRPPKVQAEVETPKRGRGRPPKVQAEVEAPKRRGRGRPPKVQAEVEAPKRRGRPPKIRTEIPVNGDANALEALQYLKQHGGSGKVRKLIEQKQAEAERLIAEAEEHRKMLDRLDTLRKMVEDAA